MPAFSMSTYCSVWASKPKVCDLFSRILPTTIEPSTPEFSAICRIGASSARSTMLMPDWTSSLSLVSLPIAALARNSATPPPETMPSSTAALVACMASSTRPFFSFTSTSHPRRQRFAFEYPGDEEGGLASFNNRLEDRQHGLKRGKLLLVDENVGIIEFGDHLLRIGDEIGREIAAIELHALDDVELGLGGL